MSNINIQALTAESARESGNILLIVAARMARRELFTPLHYVSELPQKVVSMRVFREALERSEETLQREVCKIVDGHDRLQKKLKEAEAKLEAAEKRIAELESWEKSLRTVGVMSQKAFQRLEGRESRFIALWPRPEIYLPRKRPDDGVIVYARVAGAGKGEAS